ncbi:deoxyribonuclease 1-like 2, isoform CRA_d [Mus musculus]|nr:deoxyribonuclease 1-like 2, isoform CRA_d [Mus musculus]
MLFLGDFNADCKYVKAHDWPSIRLRSSEVFKWLIPDSADTTVGNSDCAYDRIVVSGAHLRRSLKPHSASVHNFQEEFDLDQTQGLRICHLQTITTRNGTTVNHSGGRPPTH